MIRGLVTAAISIFAFFGLSSVANADASPSTAKRPVFVAFFAPKTPSGNDADVIGFSAMLLMTGERVDCTKVQEQAYALNQVGDLLRCASNNSAVMTGEKATTAEVSIINRTHAAAALLATITKFKDSGSTRPFTHKNDVLLAVAITPATLTAVLDEQGATTVVDVQGPVAKFDFHEDERQTQIVTDVGNLLSLGLALAARAGGEIPIGKTQTADVLWVQPKPYVLKYEHGKVKIDESLKDTKSLGSDYSDAALKKWQLRMSERSVDDTVKNVCPKIAKPASDDSPDVFAAAQSPFAVATCLLLDTTGGAPAAIKVSAADAIGRISGVAPTIVLRRVLSDANQPEPVRVAAGKALAGTNGTASSNPTTNRDSNQTAADTANAAVTTTMITGPIEHWYLSADVMITSGTKIGQTDQGTLQFSGNPPTFYVAVDYLFGDLNDTARPFLGNLFVKGFVKGTNRPYESFGFGLGLRGKYTKWAAFDFETFSPFVAISWTRDDASDQQPYQAHFRVGASVNLDKALAWVKSSAK